MIPARGGLILPICCKINEDLEIVYSTYEVVRSEEKSGILTLWVSAHSEVCGEILLSSEKYKPVLSEGVKFSNLKEDLYLINISGLSGEVEIQLGLNV